MNKHKVILVQPNDMVKSVTTKGIIFVASRFYTRIKVKITLCFLCDNSLV